MQDDVIFADQSCDMLKEVVNHYSLKKLWLNLPEENTRCCQLPDAHVAHECKSICTVQCNA